MEDVDNYLSKEDRKQLEGAVSECLMDMSPFHEETAEEINDLEIGLLRHERLTDKEGSEYDQFSLHASAMVRAGKTWSTRAQPIQYRHDLGRPFSALESDSNAGYFLGVDNPMRNVVRLLSNLTTQAGIKLQEINQVKPLGGWDNFNYGCSRQGENAPPGSATMIYHIEGVGKREGDEPLSVEGTAKVSVRKFDAAHPHACCLDLEITDYAEPGKVMLNQEA